MKTRSGADCKLCTRFTESRCPVHSLGVEALTARNRKVAAAARANAKPSTIDARKRAGRKGYLATVAKYGYEFAAQKLADYRKGHPSGPEQVASALFDSMGLSFEREVELLPGLFTDFVIRASEWAAPIAVEVCGYQFKSAPFGDPGRAQPDYEQRITALREAGYHPVILDTRYRETWGTAIESGILSVYH